VLPQLAGLGTANIWNFFAKMLELYPDRADPDSLWASASALTGGTT
jgi:hypothetical protein